MADYLEEINTALSVQGKDFYYESLEDVKHDLEVESEEYEDQAKQRAATALGISGSGVVGKFVPEFYSQIAEQIDSISQNDLATIGLIGALGVSTVPAYLTKRSLDESNEIDQMIKDLEEGNYHEGDTDFAHQIAEKLS